MLLSLFTVTTENLICVCELENVLNVASQVILSLFYNTVEPVLGDHPFCPAKTVAQDRWSLITGRTKIMFYRLSDLCTLLHTLAVGLIEAGMALA